MQAEGSGQGRTRAIAIALILAVGAVAIPSALRRIRSLQPTPAAADFQARVVANADRAVGVEPTGNMLHFANTKGRVVLLDFWATWCGPCQAQSPIINAVAKRYAPAGLVVLGINTSDEPGLAEAYAAKKRLEFPIVYDSGNKVAHLYQVSSLPTVIVISKAGKVVAVRAGVTSERELNGLVDHELSEPDASEEKPEPPSGH